MGNITGCSQASSSDNQSLIALQQQLLQLFSDTNASQKTSDHPGSHLTLFVSELSTTMQNFTAGHQEIFRGLASFEVQAQRLQEEAVQFKNEAKKIPSLRDLLTHELQELKEKRQSREQTKQRILGITRDLATMHQNLLTRVQQDFRNVVWMIDASIENAQKKITEEESRFAHVLDILGFFDPISSRTKDSINDYTSLQNSIRKSRTGLSKYSMMKRESPQILCSRIMELEEKLERYHGKSTLPQLEAKILGLENVCSSKVRMMRDLQECLSRMEAELVTVRNQNIDCEGRLNAAHSKQREAERVLLQTKKKIEDFQQIISELTNRLRRKSTTVQQRLAEIQQSKKLKEENEQLKVSEESLKGEVENVKSRLDEQLKSLTTKLIGLDQEIKASNAKSLEELEARIRQQEAVYNQIISKAEQTIQTLEQRNGELSKIAKDQVSDMQKFELLNRRLEQQNFCLRSELEVIAQQNMEWRKSVATTTRELEIQRFILRAFVQQGQQLYRRRLSNFSHAARQLITIQYRVGALLEQIQQANQHNEILDNKFKQLDELMGSKAEPRQCGGSCSKEKEEQANEIYSHDTIVKVTDSLWSNILVPEEKQWLADILAIQAGRKVRFFNLKMVASHHEFSTASYHRACDKLTNHLTVIKTARGFCVGGFSSLPLGAEGPDPACFLFSATRRLCMPLKPGRRGTLRDPAFGPIFGSESDLRVDERGVFSNYHIYLSSFEKVEVDGVSQRALMLGDVEDKLLQYEVFTVEFEG